ncbi:unnamed protein product [Durusdinium trenchii]|uniref:Uncharacterized protein n=1 Tax=Durusdinium trenchii TaxID=1381693 RepID=A0ABP0PLJ7_9DINO
MRKCRVEVSTLRWWQENENRVYACTSSSYSGFFSMVKWPAEVGFQTSMWTMTTSLREKQKQRAGSKAEIQTSRDQVSAPEGQPIVFRIELIPTGTGTVNSTLS